jgi:hypothetical protein
VPTPAELAAISNVAVKPVHNAIDKRIIATPSVGRDGWMLNEQVCFR